ncbi:hypothetical protein MLD38_004481 [Melastoma candidum]|uniref:Uncharacterized protein n=1 Tax=Melastoma candidum TaxID=119954 RepID=A0ACB9S9Q3_9MYRT|nr:hypothetical protein MLD38_004481 [Melastoma candidum]
MSSGSVRRVSRQDIQLVQNLIEQCLQLYMSQKEVVETLVVKAKIEPGFTELVWQKLEEENQEFFKAYYLRLTVKHQIMEFNKLLEQQVHLMHQMHPGSVPAFPSTNGTRVSQHHSGPGVIAKNMHLPVGATLVPGTFTNCGAVLPASLHTPIEMSAHINRMDAASNMLHNQSQNMGLLTGMNGGCMIKNEGGGGMIKNEASYSGASYIFGAGGNVLDARPTIDSSSFDLLGSIPRNFSLSDLTADFSQSSDILEYPRSPFLGHDVEHFLESRDRGEQGDDRRLNPITENLSYDDFDSE